MYQTSVKYKYCQTTDESSCKNLGMFVQSASTINSTIVQNKWRLEVLAHLVLGLSRKLCNLLKKVNLGQGMKSIRCTPLYLARKVVGMPITYFISSALSILLFASAFKNTNIIKCLKSILSDLSRAMHQTTSGVWLDRWWKVDGQHCWWCEGVVQ
jgi:hypothetical protein